jgi:hypothetical protein
VRLVAALAALIALSPQPAAAQQDPAAALCADQPGCRVVDRRAAGRTQVVVELAIPNGSAADADETCRPHRRQFWLIATPPRLLLDLCNDGYGAAMVGEDEVAIGPNRVTHTQSGGSAWRWSEARIFQLSPPQVLRDESRGWWTLGPNVSRTEWDWRRFTGQSQWWSPPCGSSGAPPENARAPVRLPYAYAPIPWVVPPAVPDDATEAELGSCALQVDAGGRGYVVAGRAAPAAASREWLRALLVGERTLMITIGNGPWRSSGGPDDDHVAVWLGGLVGYGTHCIDPREQATHWTIAIADGRLTHAGGDPARQLELTARRARRAGAGSVVTFVLRVPERTYTLTAVLARGDGRRPGRAIATSRLRPGVAATLGQPMPIDPSAVRCAVRDGRLDLIETGRLETPRRAQ